MYCPSCGKQIPDDSVFCLHCGGSIAAVKPTQAVTDWEYKDFVYGFPPGSTWARIGSGAYTEAGAKLEFWQNNQQEIRLKLQKWLDDGWEPVGEIGSASLRIRTYRSAKYSGFGWVVVIIISIPMFFLPLLFIWDTFAEPVEFRVTMRRPRKESPPSTEDTHPALIIVERKSQLTSSMRNFGVFIDDRKVGTIGNGRTETYQVQPGTHIAYVKLDFVSSNKLKLTLDPGEEVNLHCSASAGAIKTTLHLRMLS